MSNALHRRSVAVRGLDLEGFPALQGLGLGPPEFAALRRQGYLSRKDRAGGPDGYWRLRFRLDGRARAVYVGRDPQRVGQVRQELEALQADHHRERQVARLAKEARHAMRTAKRRSAPILRQLGFHYHGRTIRKARDVGNVA